MRLNVYTEELLPLDSTDTDPVFAEIVTTEYISSRTGLPMKNHGLRIYLKSHPDLHYVPPRDDDRSAVTFWCGPDERAAFRFWETVKSHAEASTMKLWHDKVIARQREAEKNL